MQSLQQISITHTHWKNTQHTPHPNFENHPTKNFFVYWEFHFYFHPQVFIQRNWSLINNPCFFRWKWFKLTFELSYLFLFVCIFCWFITILRHCNFNFFKPWMAVDMSNLIGIMDHTYFSRNDSLKINFVYIKLIIQYMPIFYV